MGILNVNKSIWLYEEWVEVGHHFMGGSWLLDIRHCSASKIWQKLHFQLCPDIGQIPVHTLHTEHWGLGRLIMQPPHFSSHGGHACTFLKRQCYSVFRPSKCVPSARLRRQELAPSSPPVTNKNMTPHLVSVAPHPSFQLRRLSADRARHSFSPPNRT